MSINIRAGLAEMIAAFALVLFGPMSATSALVIMGADWGTLAVTVSGGTVAPTYQYQWVKMPSGVNISNSFGGNTNSIRINSGSFIA